MKSMVGSIEYGSEVVSRLVVFTLFSISRYTLCHVMWTIVFLKPLLLIDLATLHRNSKISYSREYKLFMVLLRV